MISYEISMEGGDGLNKIVNFNHVLLIDMMDIDNLKIM